ncbi:MAG TPA: LysR substrate-binding domain-containing protein, partial [Steroidobacteraceae bacterium]|nr:LysR substrate-binding domain-containing protein [Steroidobacteraceae bacterium]
EFHPTLLTTFLKQHPDIHVHLEQHVSEDIALAVKENVADLGIVGELPMLDQLTTIPFQQDELVFVARRSDAVTKKAEVKFADVATYPFVCLDANSSLHYVLQRQRRIAVNNSIYVFASQVSMPRAQWWRPDWA